ncbi:hypothetical protein E2C01_067414 [Portunus trituberculatus]|uniref:Uncharacterized protein n=1 Tax=Portunus trituberculatus TaxID=210409 RepID=A0A5B7HTP3_PORTR|nr:hypothetical protein [Portunus trituberculatus]
MILGRTSVRSTRSQPLRSSSTWWC